MIPGLHDNGAEVQRCVFFRVGFGFKAGTFVEEAADAATLCRPEVRGFRVERTLASLGLCLGLCFGLCFGLSL